MDVRAHRIRRAGQINHLLAVLARRGAIDVVKDNVGDVDGGRVGSTLGRIDVEVTLVQHKGLVGVLDVDVAVGDVVNASIADVLASPGLEASAVLHDVIQICVQVAWVTGRVLTWPLSRVTFSMYACSMMS